MSALAGCGGGSHAASSAVTVASLHDGASSGGGASTVGGTTAATTAAGASSHVSSKVKAHRAHRATGHTGAAGAGGNAYSGIPYPIRTASMTPTYKPGTTAYYDPTRTHPRIGDVIIFYLPAGAKNGVCGAIQVGGEPCRIPAPGLSKMRAIKRVVGLPGDRIAIHSGRMIRNGRPESEPPTIPCGSGAGCQFPKAITVPAGHYFVMSDYRQLYQDDSRVFGPVPHAGILGTVEGG